MAGESVCVTDKVISLIIYIICFVAWISKIVVQNQNYAVKIVKKNFRINTITQLLSKSGLINIIAILITS